MSQQSSADVNLPKAKEQRKATQFQTKDSCNNYPESKEKPLNIVQFPATF